MNWHNDSEELHGYERQELDPYRQAERQGDKLMTSYEELKAEQLRTAVAELVPLAIGGIGGIRNEQAAEVMYNVIVRKHRTEQQEFIGVLKLFLYRYAEAGHDARNDAAVAWSKEVAALPNADLRFPYF